jgi:hypothetical protein
LYYIWAEIDARLIDAAIVPPLDFSPLMVELIPASAGD